MDIHELHIYVVQRSACCRMTHFYHSAALAPKNKSIRSTQGLIGTGKTIQHQQFCRRRKLQSLVNAEYK